MNAAAFRREALVARFRESFTGNGGTCHGPFPAGEAADVAVWLAVERSEGRTVALPTEDPLLDELSLPARLNSRGVGVLLADDAAWAEAVPFAGVGLTAAAYGLATTGSVGVVSGPGRPRSVSLVPPAHVCLLPETALVEDLSEALALASPLPSAITWISGPSRSADLEMSITIGVHGPGSVDVVLVA